MGIPFCGPTYMGRSANIDASRCINFFPEINPAPDAKSQISLVGTPGTTYLGTVGAGPINLLYTFRGVLFAISASQIYYTPGLNVTAFATLGAVIGGIAAEFAAVDNGVKEGSGLLTTGGDQVAVVTGDSGYIYIIGVTSSLTVSLAKTAFPAGYGPTSVEYSSGYFIAGDKLTRRFYVSALFDGTTWPGLATAVVLSASDTPQACVAYQQQLHFIGSKSSEVWAPNGVDTSQGCPFSLVPGSSVPYGTVASKSVARGDGGIYFLASQQTAGGGGFYGVVVKQGYTIAKISPPSIDYLLSQMGDLSTAYAYVRSSEGHTFYVLTIPSGNATLVYDSSTQMWHEWSWYEASYYQVGRHIGRSYINYTVSNSVASPLGEILGSYLDNRIYMISSSVYADAVGDPILPAGRPIASVRTAAHLTDSNTHRRIFFNELVIDCETGSADLSVSATSTSYTGYADGSGTADGSELADGVSGAAVTASTTIPVATLSWSNDSGHTWSNEYQCSLGAVGEYSTRAVWRRLGRARDRVYRLMISDPIRKVITGAYMGGDV